ncbi:ATP-dependent zinc metalloprotease FTSH 12, chloroplastic [Linum perenne]
MESLIPEPSPVNIRKFKKGVWKKTIPKGLKMKKFIKGPDGTLVRDTSYVGEDAWDDDAGSCLVKKLSDSNGATALWISKRWWQYRPTIPYTYFLQKLDSSEVAAVVFTEDLKRVYITMKEGFPLEYVVNIPLDPYLFESIASSGVEVDLLQKQQIHYFLKLLIALGPGLLVLLLIRASIILLLKTLNRFMRRRHRQLREMIHSEILIVAIGDGSDTKSEYKGVVLGGDVWESWS